MQKKPKISTRALVTVGVLAALSVVFRLFLGYPQTGSTRYDLGFLPIAAVGQMFGPIWSGVAYVIADLVGTFFTGQSPYPPITLCKFLFGLIFGLFFYRKKLTLPRIILCVLTISAAVDLIAMPLALSPLMKMGALAILVQRLIQVAVMFPIRTISIWLMGRYLGKYLDKYAK